MHYRNILSEFDTKWRTTISRVCLEDWTPLPALRYTRSMGNVAVYTYYVDGCTTTIRSENALLKKLKELKCIA